MRKNFCILYGIGLCLLVSKSMGRNIEPYEAMGVQIHENLKQEECGDGYTCLFDGRIEAYGCAPIDNHTATACCSSGQGCEQAGEECGKWCVDCSSSTPCNLKPGQIPYCPGNGATGDGCVRYFSSY